jgi:hypothetical protein
MFTLGAMIIDFMGQNLVIIVVQNLFFISSYGIDTNVIHLFVFLNIDFMCII